MLYNIKDFTKELNIYNTIEFKKLDNFDNYFIYEDGRVFSFKIKRLLKNKLNKRGYCEITLCDNNKKLKYYSVHRLVYEAFKGPIQKGLQVDHINGIRNDNRLINLRLLTPKENTQNRHYLEQYREVDKKNYIRKKEYNKQYFKEYRKTHKEEIREMNKKYREEHKEEIKRKRREKYRLNKLNKMN